MHPLFSNSCTVNFHSLILRCKPRFGATALGLVLTAGAAVGAGMGKHAEPPPHLSDTRLFVAGSSTRTRADVAAVTPQYTLWSDGADKRRWMRLPRGTSIDGRAADAWQFPAGTQLWKEFAFNGKPVETRTIERLGDGSWRFASYIWRADGSEADLAPMRGATLQVPDAPGGRYVVPGRGDCVACHGSAAVPVLGVTALQLSSDRDPNALHPTAPVADALDIHGLVTRGWLRGLPTRLLRQQPRIASDSPIERAALGYLHANCGHCHNRSGNQAPVTLTLAQSALQPEASRRAVLDSMLDQPARYQKPGALANTQLLQPGDAGLSLLVQRMASRQALAQMPPLGSERADTEAVGLISQWINQQHPTKTKE